MLIVESLINLDCRGIEYPNYCHSNSQKFFGLTSYNFWKMSR